MTTWYGWAGTILNVDLTKMTVSREPLSKEFATKYIGGSGFGARILYDEVGPGDNALGPENVVIITQGPLSGTVAPSGGRYELISKSPLTGICGRSNGGGFFGPEMKWAGYDLIVIRGKAEKPVYLWIDDDKVELRDAKHLWGKGVWTARRMIQEELGDAKIQTLVIGPSGENLGYSSCVISNLGRAAGKCSIGAVWGSKRLKAVAVRERKGVVSVAKPKEFMELCIALGERFKSDPVYERHTTYGTPAWVSTPILAAGIYKGGQTLQHEHFDPLFDKNLACFGCGLHCSHYYTVKSGKYKGTAGEGVEGLTILMAGSLRIGNPDFVCRYNNVCNQLGLHTEAPGFALAWAMDLYEDGIITKEDTDGIELTWGNEEAVLQFLPKIARKEGFGEILDSYPIRAAQKLGRGSEDYISHVKGGLGRGTTDMVRSLQHCLGMVVATRGRDHLTGAPAITSPNVHKWIPNDAFEKVGNKRYNDPRILFKRFSPNPKMPLIVYDTENINAICDITGVCKFASEWTLLVEGLHMEDFAQLLSTATGIDFSVDGLINVAGREFLLERAFNGREGIRRIDDYPQPYHYKLKYGKENPRYDYSKFEFSIEDYDKVLDGYYKVRGCDREGIPTRGKLESLGLKDVADDLERHGILSP